MKLIIERSALTAALGRAARIVERRNTIPVCSNVLLRAQDDRLTLKATDLDLDIVEAVAAQVLVPGEITAPAHMLSDIVRKLADGAQVTLELSERGTLAVKSGRSRFQLQTIPASDFPDIAAGEMAARFDIDAKVLKRLFDKAAFAISTEETRYYLNGIFLHAVDGQLRAVATDGHRLARITAPAPDGAAGMPAILVPRKTVGEVAKLLADATGSCQVEASSAKVRVTIGRVILTSKLIDGQFPDYERVIPDNPRTLTVDKAEVAAAADRVSTVATERGRAVKLSASTGALVLSSINPDAGEALDELDVSYDDADMEIGFNSKYLAEILSHCDGDTVEMRLAEPGSPTLFRGGGVEDATFVLMPMRV